MTDNEMRIVIAEKCGWVREPCPGCTIIYHARWSKDFGKSVINSQHLCDLPDYPTDLNAMHEAEKTLTGNQFIEYIRTLKYVCNPGCNLTNEHNQFSHVTATARQRAEAFIKTVCPEKWKGNE